MKVLSLRCANGHGFEGWFGSDDDYMAQNGRGLVECPLCADKLITRMPTAPRLNLSGAKEPRPSNEPTAQKPLPKEQASQQHLPVMVQPPGGDAQAQMQALWLQAVRHVVANTEDVGERFAEEARRIHYGETRERAIRGAATAQEREALLDEGIEVMALPLPHALKGPVQ
jgi:hypothetical protein